MDAVTDAIEAGERPTAEDLRAAWPLLTPDERLAGWRLLGVREDREDFFLTLNAADQCDLILSMPQGNRRSWFRLLDPDDATDVLQDAPEEERPGLMNLLDASSQREVTALLAFAEDDAGGLMNPRFARARPEMKVDEALRYVQRQAREKLETVYYIYVLNARQELQGIVSIRELLTAPPESTVREIMEPDVVVAEEEMDQEVLSRLFAAHDLVAIPVVDKEGRVQGIVTVDDIVDVVQEEATEDMQLMGGTEALDDPYLQTGLLAMVRKRGVWLSVLFAGQLATAWAMGLYEAEQRALVYLPWFIPLIVASGGNSGSQASTLVIRAMALGEVRVRDWWTVVAKELAAGVTLGLALGLLGVVCVLAWEALGGPFGDAAFAVGLTVGTSILGVVTWGTIVGSMLPFLFRRVGFDPASASAPFVATLVDVCGVLIYFTLATLFLARLL